MSLARFIFVITIFQLVEIYILMLIAQSVSIGFAVLLTVGTGVVGGYLARLEGFAVMMRIQEAMMQGIPPAQELLDGGFVLAGGVMLMTPGVISDTLGILCLLRPTRRFMQQWLLQQIKKRQVDGVIHVQYRDLP